MAPACCGVAAALGGLVWAATLFLAYQTPLFLPGAWYAGPAFAGAGRRAALRVSTKNEGDPA